MTAPTTEAQQTKKNNYPIQKINAAEAAWIFVSASSEPQDVRHLNDIIWYVDCLRAKGVPDDRIFIFQDHPEYKLHLTSFGIEKNIFDLADFQKTVPNIQDVKFLFLAFTGHGSSEGVHTGDIVMNPTDFTRAVRSIKGLQNGVFIVGQCYGGIFDFLDASEKPEIGFLGATKLNLSLSLNAPFVLQKIELKNIEGKVLPAWNTNVFLFYFFQWIRNAKDIDGDGVASILDGFKYAGSKTNTALTEYKAASSLDLGGDVERAKKFLREHFSKTAEQQLLENPIMVDTAFATAMKGSRDLFLHQEPWILHASLLRSLALN